VVHWVEIKRAKRRWTPSSLYPLPKLPPKQKQINRGLMTSSTEYKLPKVLEVKTATIEVPFRLEVDSLHEYEKIQRDITHVLALLPDEDKAAATIEDDGIYISTDCYPAIKFANDRYLLNEFDTCVDNVVDSVVTHHNGAVCCDCVEKFVDEALDKYFEVVTLNGGVFIEFHDEPRPTPMGAVQ
jgi:hypothetical protein